MLSCGVDVGSATAKAVVFDGARVVSWALSATGWSPKEAGRAVWLEALARAGLRPGEVAGVVATGYGRVVLDFATRRVTEITCHARGASFLSPGTGLVIDLGGQDCKAIALDQVGNVVNFKMNDRCAAGTGRFLQLTTASLGQDLSDLPDLEGVEAVRISSMCTVFAESEVVGLLAQGVAVEGILAGLFESIAGRTANMALSLAPSGGTVTFTGGAAGLVPLRRALAKALGLEVYVPPRPQLVGALGAALLGQDAAVKEERPKQKKGADGPPFLPKG